MHRPTSRRSEELNGRRTSPPAPGPSVRSSSCRAFCFPLRGVGRCSPQRKRGAGLGSRCGRDGCSAAPRNRAHTPEGAQREPHRDHHPHSHGARRRRRLKPPGRAHQERPLERPRQDAGLVKHLLRNHGYPPDKQEHATQLVLAQAEVVWEGWVAWRMRVTPFVSPSGAVRGQSRALGRRWQQARFRLGIGPSHDSESRALLPAQFDPAAGEPPPVGA